MPPPVPEQAIDTGAPYQPLGYGLGAQPVPDKVPASRGVVDYVTDTILTGVQSALSIPAGLAGASTRVPEGTPGMIPYEERRANQNYLTSLSARVGGLKSERGQWEDEHPSNFLTDPVHSTVQAAAGIVPQLPVMALGWGAPAVYGTMGVGEVANQVNDRIRFADEDELNTSPVYRQLRQQGMDDRQAREELYKRSNDLTANLVAGGGNALGGGLLTHIVGKFGAQKAAQAITDSIMGKWWKRGLVGGAEGELAGVLMGGPTQYGVERSLNQVGLGKPPDIPGIAGHAAIEALPLAVFGAIGKMAQRRPAPPIGTEQEVTARSMQAPPQPSELETPAFQRRGGGPGGPTGGGGPPEGPYLPTREPPELPGFGEYWERQAPAEPPTGPRPGIEEEYGDQLPPEPDNRPPYMPPRPPGGGGPPVRPGAESFADFAARQAYERAQREGAPPEATGAGPSFAEWSAARNAPTEYGEPIVEPLAQGPRRRPPGLPSQERPMEAGDVYPPGSREALEGEHQRKLQELEDLKAERDQAADRLARAQQRGAREAQLAPIRDAIARMDDEIQQRRLELGDIVRRKQYPALLDLARGREQYEAAQAPPTRIRGHPLNQILERAPRPGAHLPTPEEEPLPGYREYEEYQAPGRRGPPEEPPPRGGGEPPEEPPPGGGGAEVTALHQPFFEPRFAHLTTDELRGGRDGLQHRLDVADRAHQRARNRGDADGMLRIAQRMERLEDLIDAVDDEIAERERHPAAADRFISSMRDQPEDVTGRTGAQALEELDIRPRRPGREQPERVLPETANEPGRPILQGRELTRREQRERQRRRAPVEVRQERGEREVEVSRTPTVVERRRIREEPTVRPGEAGRLIVQKAQDRAARRKLAESTEKARREEGGAEIRGGATEALEPREVRERRAEERRRREEGEDTVDTVADRLLERQLAQEQDRATERKRLRRLVKRLIPKFRAIADHMRVELADRISALKADIPFAEFARSGETESSLTTERRRERDRLRRARQRDQEYALREDYAKLVQLGDTLSVPELNTLVARGLTQQLKEGDWGAFQPRGRRGEDILTAGIDPRDLSIEDQLRNFEVFVNEAPVEHLRNIAAQLRDELAGRLTAGEKAYALLEKRLTEQGVTPQIRLTIKDRRGRGDWHKRFAANRQFIKAIDTLIGKRVEGRQTIGQIDTARSDRQRADAYRRLRQKIGDFYYDELMMRTGGIAEISKAHLAELRIAQALFRGVRERYEDPEDVERAIQYQLSDQWDMYAGRWAERDTPGRERDTTAESELSDIFTAIDRIANPEEYRGQQITRAANRALRTALYRFNRLIDEETTPDVLDRARELLDVLIPHEMQVAGGTRPVRYYGSERMRDARRDIVEAFIKERRERALRDDARRSQPQTADEYERLIYNEEAVRAFNLGEARRFSPDRPQEWYNLPPEFKQLSMDYGVMIRPQDIPPVGERALPKEGHKQFVDRLVSQGMDREQAERAYESFTTTATGTKRQLPIRHETTRTRDDQLQRAETAAREQAVMEASPKMTLGDLYLPIPEQLEFIRRLRDGTASEDDFALRAEQLVARANRLMDALNSIDPAVWGDTERAWAGEGLQRLHEESRARAGEPTEAPETLQQGFDVGRGREEHLLPSGQRRVVDRHRYQNVIEADRARWTAELQRVEDEARFHYERMNPDTAFMEFGVGNVLDPAAPMRTATGEGSPNLPRGAYVTRVSDFAKPGVGYAVQTKNRMVQHFLRIADRLVGNLDIVHLTDEQMDMALRERGLREGTPSFYDRPTDRIIVRQSALKGVDRNRLLIHEMAHPIMEAAAQNDKLRSIVRRLDEQRAALKEAFDNPQHPQHRDVVRLLDGNEHGLENVHEFFSELWSNDDFNKALHAVKTTAEQRDRWKTGSREATLLASVLADIKRGLTGMFFTVSKQRLLNDSSIASLDLLQRMEAQGRGRPYMPIGEGEPLARASTAQQIEAWFNRQIGKLPPVADGMTRLFRVESKIKGDIPDWLQQGVQERGLDKVYGRWYFIDPRQAEFYIRDVGPENARLRYIDLPAAEAKRYNVAKHPEALRYSRDPENEFFLPQGRVGKEIPTEPLARPAYRNREKMDVRSNWGTTIPVTKNPTLSDVRGIAARSKYKAVRTLMDRRTGDIYAWNADHAMHAPMSEFLGVDGTDFFEHEFSKNIYMSRGGTNKIIPTEQSLRDYLRRETPNEVKKTFDLRTPEGRALYDELRAESRKSLDPDDHLQPTERLERGTFAMIKDALRERGYDSALVHTWSNNHALTFIDGRQYEERRGQGPMRPGQRSTGRELLTWLDRKLEPDSPVRAMMSSISHLVDDVRVHINQRGYVGGAYYPDTHYVGTAAHPLTAAHELAHAATVYAMEKNPAFEKALSRIIGHIQDSPQFARYVMESKKAGNEALARDTRFTDTPYEYIAEYMANPKVRALADSIKTNPKLLKDIGLIPARKSLLRATADLIAKWLRIENRKAGGTTGELTGKILEDILREQEKILQPGGFMRDLIAGNRAGRRAGELGWYGETRSAPGRPGEGFIRGVWDYTHEKAKDIAWKVNQAGGPTGMLMQVMNFADLPRAVHKDPIMAAAVQRIYNTANKQAHEVKSIKDREDYPVIREVAKLTRVTSPAHWEAVTDYIDHENYVGASGRHKLGEGDNAWVGTDRDDPGNRQVHNEWKKLNEAWNDLPKPLQDMVLKLREFYKGRYDDIRNETLRDLIHLRDLVPKESTEAMMKLVSEGRDALTDADVRAMSKTPGFDGLFIDRPNRKPNQSKYMIKPEDELTEANQHFRDHLRELNIPEFRKIAGVYYPMMRRGDYVVQAFFNLKRFAEQFGGVQNVDKDLKDRAAIEHWEFDSKDNANKFIDRLSQDDAPFIKVNRAYETADGKWRVDANAMSLQFFKSGRAAAEAHARLAQDPNVDPYHLQQRREYFKGGMNPAWATKVMTDLVNAMKRTATYRGYDESTQETLSRQWQELAVRHLLTTSARSRYLPRTYVHGADKGVLDNLMQYSHNTAMTLAEKRLAPQMRDAVTAMDDHVRAMRNAKDPVVEAWGLKRTQVQAEVHRRLMLRPDWQRGPIDKAIQTLLKMSFLDKLMSPGFLLLNASEPWTIAAPLLAGDGHGLKAYSELAKAYNIIGAGNVYWKGAQDFAKVAKHGMNGDPQLADTMTTLMEKVDRVGHGDAYSNAKQIRELFQTLQEHGYLDRNAGMELEHIYDPTRSAPGRFLDWTDNMFRQGNVAVENVNRGVIGVAAYRLAKQKGMSHEKAIEYAQGKVDEAAGNYGYVNAPPIFNHPLGRLALQFKKYALRMTSNIIRAFAGAVRGDPHGMSRLVAMMASQSVMSGMLGLPTEPIKAAITATNWLGINPYNTDDVERILNERLAKVMGVQGKDMILYGLPRVLGTGFGQRTGWDTLWTYGTLGRKPDEWWQSIGHLLGGSSVGTLFEMAQGVHDMSRGVASWLHGARSQAADDITNGIHNLVPIKVISDMAPALRDYYTGRQKPSGQPFDFKPNLGDTISKIAGIRTARELSASQARAAFVRQRDVYNEDRSRALQAYAQARTPGERASVRQWILREWNQGRPNVQKIDFSDMQKASTSFERKQKLSPADLGLAITKRTRPFAPDPNVWGFMPAGS